MLKEIIDNLRSVIWEVNSMMTMSCCCLGAPDGKIAVLLVDLSAKQVHGWLIVAMDCGLVWVTGLVEKT